MSDYNRVLLKLSGEALRPGWECPAPPRTAESAGLRPGWECPAPPRTAESAGLRPEGGEAHKTDVLSAAMLTRMAREIAAARRERNFELGIVIGGGNIFRGLPRGEDFGLQRTTGDQMGMLATLINCLALRDAINTQGLAAEVHSAVAIPGVAPAISAHSLRPALAAGTIILFACGTGNPFFTTDTAAALRAAEIRADVLYKATKVDGVYSADPARDPQAKRYDRISYAEVLEKRLAVMDLTAISFCMENKVPICVFSMLDEGAVTKALLGQVTGTVVSC